MSREFPIYSLNTYPASKYSLNSSRMVDSYFADRFMQFEYVVTVSNFEHMTHWIKRCVVGENTLTLTFLP